MDVNVLPSINKVSKVTLLYLTLLTCTSGYGCSKVGYSDTNPCLSLSSY